MDHALEIHESSGGVRDPSSPSITISRNGYSVLVVGFSEVLTEFLVLSYYAYSFDFLCLLGTTSTRYLA
jgi:hypothetical protein